jgi:hypothetical protein
LGAKGDELKTKRRRKYMNRKKISLGLLFLMIALVVVPGASASVDYSTTIQPIFTANCTIELSNSESHD